MTKGFNNQDTAATVTISQIRNMAYNRLQSAQRRVDPANTATASFNRAANNNSSQDSLIGGLIFGMLTWVPFMDSLGGAFDIDFDDLALGGISVQTANAIMDGVSALWDEKAYKNREIKDGVYHGGRRQDPIVTGNKMAKKFNLVSANENSRYSYDANAEIAGMNEILDMLDTLEKRGVSMIRLEQKDCASTVLKNASRKRSGFSVMTGGSSLRMAV
jgi:hypothetical protein